MNTQVIKKVEEKQAKKRPDVKTGDTVKLHLIIKDRGNVRSQIFEGTVISIKGSGMSRMITVRKMSNGVGVEKIIPVNSPSLSKIEVVKRGKVRRSKLFYMRDKIGKRAMEVNQAQSVYFADEEESESETKENADENDAEKSPSDKNSEDTSESTKTNATASDNDSGPKDANKDGSDSSDNK